MNELLNLKSVPSCQELLPKYEEKTQYYYIIKTERKTLIQSFCAPKTECLVCP